MIKCIVIGAGIAGASTAYHLAKLGAETLLIDRRDRGQATAAAAGIICPWLSQRRNKAWYRLAKEGARFYPGLIEQLKLLGEQETGYAQVGALHLRSNPDKLPELEERARLRKLDAPEIGDIEVCDERSTLALFPLLADGHRSLRIGGAARVDGRALRDALIRAAIKLGATYSRGDASLTFEGDRVTGVTIRNKLPCEGNGNTANESVSTVKADKVIVCAGAWAAEVFRPLGISMRISRQKAQIAHLGIEDGGATGEWPVVMPPSDQYLLAFDGGRIVVGATHENNPHEDDTKVTAGGLQELLNKALTAAPGLAEAEFLESRVGFRPFTPGFLPVYGAIPGWSGLLTANGLGASGLTAGPYIGEQLAKLALDLKPDIDPADYDVLSAMGQA